MARTRTFSRNYWARLNPDQYQELLRANVTSDQLHNFALKWLYTRFGYRAKRRPFPQSREKRWWMMREIQDAFMMEFGYHKVTGSGKIKWNTKVAGMSSKEVAAQLEDLADSFMLYRRGMMSMARAKDKHKANYLRRRKRPWYTKGAISFVREHGSSKRALVFKQYKNSSDLDVIRDCSKDRPKAIVLPHFGEVKLTKPLVQRNGVRIRTARMRLVREASPGKHALVRVSVVYEEAIPDLRDIQSKVGLDWGMYNYAAYTTDTGQVYQLPKEIVEQAEAYDMEIRRIQSIRWGLSPSRWRRALRRLQRLHAKRTHLVDEYYRSLARELVSKHDLIAIERLEALSMRKRGCGTAQTKGFNRKLSLLKPGRSRDILEAACIQHGVTLIQVDPYKTSQVEFDADYHIDKHDLSERSWVSTKTGRLINRDENAAKNILHWALSPKDHIKAVENRAARKVDKSVRRIKPHTLITVVTK